MRTNALTGNMCAYMNYLMWDADPDDRSTREKMLGQLHTILTTSLKVVGHPVIHEGMVWYIDRDGQAAFVAAHAASM